MVHELVLKTNTNNIQSKIYQNKPIQPNISKQQLFE